LVEGQTGTKKHLFPLKKKKKKRGVRRVRKGVTNEDHVGLWILETKVMNGSKERKRKRRGGGKR